MRHLPHIFAALILALSATAAQAEISWEANLRTAKEKAEQEGKLLLLHFYSDNCVWCDRLEAGAFTSPEVAQAIHRSYVPVKIHGGHNPGVAAAFQINGYPTDVIVTPDGKALAHGTSPQAADQYIAMLTHNAAALTNTTLAGAAPAAAPQTTQDPANGYAPPAGQVAANQVAANQAPPSLAQSVPTDMPGADAPGVGTPGVGAANGDAATVAAAAGTPAIAASHRNAPSTSIAALPPAPLHKLALDGYCAVSLLEKNDWIEGSPEFGVIHLGNLYLFVDEAAMVKFLADPEPFTPVLNGIDVVRFFEEKKIVQGKRDFGVRDPDHNRMFFFADHAAMVHFENQHMRYTEDAIKVTRQAVADANPRR